MARATVTALLGLLLALGMFSAACGGDSKNANPPGTAAATDERVPTRGVASPELQAYFTDVEGLATTLDSKSTPIFTTLSATTDLAEAKDAFGQFPDVLETFIDGLSALDPPEEVAVEHAASVSAGQAFLDQVRSANDEAQNTTSLLDFAAAYSKVTNGQQGTAFTNTCAALQAIATSYTNINVDLGCAA